MLMLKLIQYPIKALFGTAKVSAKAGYKAAKTGAVATAKTAKGSAKAGYVAGRTVGYKRMTVFGAGVAVGVLVANPKARQAAVAGVQRLWTIRQTAAGPDPAEIEDLVRRRLNGAQATWHLPQPEITVDDGRVILEGEVPHPDGRRALGEEASLVDGVREVENRVIVTELSEAS